jgi:hypothetical protein
LLTRFHVASEAGGDTVGELIPHVVTTTTQFFSHKVKLTCETSTYGDMISWELSFSPLLTDSDISKAEGSKDVCELHHRIRRTVGPTLHLCSKKF